MAYFNGVIDYVQAFDFKASGDTHYRGCFFTIFSESEGRRIITDSPVLQSRVELAYAHGETVQVTYRSIEPEDIPGLGDGARGLDGDVGLFQLDSIRTYR